MSIELTMLLYTVVLFFVQLIAHMGSTLIEFGIGYGASARDEDIAPGTICGRLERAYYNLLETMPPFAALVLIGLYTGKVNEMTALGAQIYFWGRVAYVPAYISGIPFLRSTIWFISTVGMAIILWQLLA
ncbi:MAG: MAPEG family protein [Rhizobiaceae bacterium]|nr:MAPEG family protein [Rhizobiaceae bacterium]